MGHNKKQKFSLVLVKPSHYDDDGYVIQWFRSSMPANSLACLYGLAVECDKEEVLGENVELEIHAFVDASICFIKGMNFPFSIFS
jgi:hypothetical protein